MQDATAGAAAARGRKAKQGKAGNPVDPSKPRIQLSHRGTAGSPRRQSLPNSEFPHVGLHTPKLSASHPGGVPRSLIPGRPGLLGGNGPTQPSAPALGVVYFSSGCQSNRNNSGCLNPLNTTAQTDPDQRKADFASEFSYFFPHIPKSIFSETKNLPNPHPKLKLFSKLSIKKKKKKRERQLPGICPLLCFGFLASLID